MANDLREKPDCKLLVEHLIPKVVTAAMRLSATLNASAHPDREVASAKFEVAYVRFNTESDYPLFMESLREIADLIDDDKVQLAYMHFCNAMGRIYGQSQTTRPYTFARNPLNPF